MTPREEAPVTVTQADRNDAADLYLNLDSEVTAEAKIEAAAIRNGMRDYSPAVQWFARHRTQSAAAAKAREEGMREALTPSGDTKAAYMVEDAAETTDWLYDMARDMQLVSAYERQLGA